MYLLPSCLLCVSGVWFNLLSSPDGVVSDEDRDGHGSYKHTVLSTYGAKSHAKSHVASRDLPSSPTTPPVFHVSMLEPHTPNEILNRVQSPPPPVDVQGDLEYEIAEVVDSKIDKRRSCKLLYLVRWLGYENTDEEFSWLPATELENAKDLVSDFHSGYPGKPGPLSSL